MIYGRGPGQIDRRAASEPFAQHDLRVGREVLLGHSRAPMRTAGSLLYVEERNVRPDAVGSVS